MILLVDCFQVVNLVVVLNRKSFPRFSAEYWLQLFWFSKRGQPSCFEVKDLLVSDLKEEAGRVSI